ncbi:MAG TPA: DHHA1 domain-containing protein [Candidatus Binataceae bacterium]|nr:DHHA1 domain-containing protein [Candidatus Binataceae bacterium]
MPKRDALTIQVVSHGPSCLDGVTAAAAVRRFHASERVQTVLAPNGDTDRLIQLAGPKGPSRLDELWITDLSWTSTDTAEHLRQLLRKGTRVYWIDHHRTAVSRLDAPEFDVPFTAKVLTEEFSAARLTYNFLRQRAAEAGDPSRLSAFERFGAFAAIADDHDRWVHQVPGSEDWALAVQTLGGIESYREIIRLEDPVMTRRLKTALEAGRAAMEKSFDIARTTMVEKSLGNGISLRSACCIGYSSEVAAKLYEEQHHTVIALFDLRSLGVSLRRSADCEVDLSELARHFGGGGHAAAAGFSIADIKRAPAERLVKLLGEVLLNPS